MPIELAGNWWQLVLLGLCAGVLGGTLGVGGGIIMVPALVLIFHLPQRSAQGTALAVMVPMALLGAFRYWKNPQIVISPPVAALIAIGALVGVLIGAELAGRLPGHVLRKVFAVFMIVVAVRLLLSPGKPKGRGPASGPASSQMATRIDYEGAATNESGSSERK